MEATPSLACANKCIFCWRHHQNPVGTAWRWKTDDPRDIVEGFIMEHLKMIKPLKGLPDLDPSRFAAACRVKHCALSLVGEPVMYPRLNELLAELHARHVSTFLVTNAQFPDAMRRAPPCTQLYVSVDGAEPSELKAVGRPLFTDFWDRYMESLDVLRLKEQRTVFRLTLIKERNMGHLQQYADLVERGQPDFIEVKGVTYCGTSSTSGLTIKNCPWHEEVLEFCESLAVLLRPTGRYALAAEHRHSCSALIAHTKFRVDGKWHTWIDFERFHELVDRGAPFAAEDYIRPTPDWAVFGSGSFGFDPEERQGPSKSRTPRVVSCHPSSESTSPCSAPDPPNT
eukprot:Polyplicarium_translucidae@DN1580_c0_g1_i2.p1